MAPYPELKMPDHAALGTLRHRSTPGANCWRARAGTGRASQDHGVARTGRCRALRIRSKHKGLGGTDKDGTNAVIPSPAKSQKTTNERLPVTRGRKNAGANMAKYLNIITLTPFENQTLGVERAKITTVEGTEDAHLKI